MAVNVTVLVGLTSSRSRKDLPLALGQTSGDMTCLCPASARSCLPSSTVSFCLCPLSLSHIVLHLFLFHCLSCFSLAHSSLLYLLLTLLFFVLVTMATAFFEWGGKAIGLMEDTGAYDALAIYHCPSLTPLKSLSLSSLQLTAARGKSCWTSARSMPFCCAVCPVIVYLRSKT